MIIGRATAGRTLGIGVALISVHADAFVAGGIDDGPMAPRPEPSGRTFA